MPNQTWEELLASAEKEGSLTGGFTPIKPGRYSFVVVDATAEKTKDGRKDQINIRVKVLNDGEEKNKTMFHRFTISPESAKALNIFFREMNVLGVDRAFFGSNPTPEQVAQKAVNAVFEAEVYLNGEYTNLRSIRTASDAARQAAASLVSGAPAPSPTASVSPSVPVPAPAPAAPAPEAVQAPVPPTEAVPAPTLPPPPPKPQF